MIDLYAWATPNSRKVTILLEELGLAYRLHPVQIRLGEQHRHQFLAINPNNKIPALVDHETGIQTFESGAILIYLAEKTGRFLPKSGQARAATLHWLMWQMSGFGPMLGNLEHFSKLNPGRSADAEAHFQREIRRLYGVLNGRLGETDHLNGDAYSIADMATWPWVAGFEWQGLDLGDFPHVLGWYNQMVERPGVIRGWAAVEEGSQPPLYLPQA